MAEKIQWGRIRHAYICGSMSQKELAKKWHISESRISVVAKKEEWVKQRKEYRGKAGALALSRACVREAEKLDKVRQAADDLGQMLAEAMTDAEQLHLHTAVVRDVSGAEHIEEQRLDAINHQALRAVAASLNDLTKALKTLYGLRTEEEIKAERLANERLAIEREKLALEKAKAGAEDGGNSIEIILDGAAEEMAT